MSQGIVRITPRPGAMGILQVTVADPNKYGVKFGDVLDFKDPGFNVDIGDLVDCIIDSKTVCTVTRVVIPVPVPEFDR